MRTIFLILFSAFVLTAQTTKPLTFDVVSVRPITDPTIVKSGDITYHTGTLYMNGVTLGYAIQWAFDIQNYQLEGPDWIHWRPANDQPRFSISAKADEKTSKADARIMTQHLLIERFGLVFHFEQRMKPGYTLREDPKGLKIERIEATDVNPLMSFDRNTNKALFRNMNIEELCGDIALTIKEPVVNGTSLQNQTFNATAFVQWDTPDEMPNALLTALRHDIGLVPVREKVPVKTVVVDQINRVPTSN
jgi:uncharacterized protein (TIGR03435 family)